MNMQLTRWIAVTLLSSAMAACGGGGDATDGTGSGSGGGGGGGGSSTDTPVPALGVLTATFSAGTLDIGTSPLSAGGSSGVRVDIVDTANGNTLITDSITVTFSSTCISQGTATMPAVTTTTGSVSATYTDQGCGATDTITARATVNGTLLQAAGDITVLPDTLGSISFVDAEPESIGLRSTGNEQSRVTFKVVSGSGGPVRGQDVTFTLDTTVGGITFIDGSTTATAKTGTTGEVSVIVKSGTRSTVVRVRATATVGTTTISSQSEKLTIETSIADQDSFTIAAEVLNPLGFGCVGTEDEITVRLADRYNNPVKDGTAVNFTTEGGVIEPSCLTEDGACSVTWTSQNPLPKNYCRASVVADIEDTYNTDCGDGTLGDLDDLADTTANGPRPGRTTILATAIGEETFVDSDDDGLYDDTDAQFYDLGEAILDKNMDGTFDLLDTFVDFNKNGGAPDGGSGKFTGLLCQGPTLCDSLTTSTSLNVRASMVLSMSAGFPDFSDADHVFPDAGLVYNPTTQTFSITAKATKFVGFLLRDVNRQPLPAGTTISAAIDGDGTVVAGASQTDKGSNDDSAAANIYYVGLKGADTAGGSGALELKITVEGCAGADSKSISYFFIVNTI